MMAERDGKQYTGGAKKTFLTVPVNTSEETLTVADASTFPDPAVIATPGLGDPVPASSLPFAITINRGMASEEKVLIQSRVGNTLTVKAGGRGYDGTAAATHSEQASVEHTIDAFSMSKFMEHTNDPALTDAHFIPQINGLQAKVNALDNHVDAASTTAHAISNVTGLQTALNAKAPDADLTTAEGRITVNEGDISAIEGAATTLTGRVTAVEPGVTPVGGIIMYSGVIASLPTNWKLCDGTAGTPDLRGRFVVGAEGSYAQGATGGADAVTLTKAQMPAHQHTITTWNASTSTHGHSNSTVFNHRVAAPPPIISGQNQAESTTKPSVMSAEGGGGSHENRPPYYALAYVMRVS